MPRSRQGRLVIARHIQSSQARAPALHTLCLFQSFPPTYDCELLFMINHGPRLSFVIALLIACVFPLQAQDISVDKAFSAVPFELWSQQERRMEIPWKVEIKPYGLSLHQRLRAYVEIELKRRELAKRAQE